MRAGRGAALGLLLGWGLACSSPPPLAELRQRAGTVERDFGARQRAWSPADVGARFGLGDGIQTLDGASALLALDDGAQLSMEPRTLIRFSATPPKPHTAAFDLELGAALLEVAAEPLLLDTPEGPARLAPRTRMTLQHSDGGLRFVVQVGQAVLEEFAPLNAGDGLLIDARGVGTRLGETGPSSAAPAAVVSPLPDPEPPERSLDVTAKVRGRRASVRTGTGWKPLAEGSTQLIAGSELELGGNTEVELTRGGQRASLRQNGRYVVTPRPGVLVAASAGSLGLGSDDEVAVEVPGGVIVVAAHGLADVRLDKSGSRVEVRAETARIESARGRETLSPGEDATLARNGELSVRGRSLDYADIDVQVGESLVVHDPAPPTAVRFAFPGVCEAGGTLRLSSNGRAGAYAAGHEQVSLGVSAGHYRYELRCSDGEKGGARQGRISVLKDAGTRALAVHPPSTLLQADGRNYTVLYQNRLPDITLAWPNAPSGSAVRLVHEFGGVRRELVSGEPSYRFASGSLDEGEHLLHFIGDAKVSRQTTLNIRFDNAAPAAALNTPPTLGSTSDGPVTISGVALPGWNVTVEGKPAPRDAQGRFSLPASLPTDRRAVVIRISHPERGVHAYLRRGRS